MQAQQTTHQRRRAEPKVREGIGDRRTEGRRVLRVAQEGRPESGLWRISLLDTCRHGRNYLNLSFLRPVHTVLEAVYERLPGGFDNVLPDTDGTPDVLAVGRVYEDAGRGGGGAVLVEDAHLVVGEVDLL